MLSRRSYVYISMSDTPRSENDPRDSLHVVERRRDPKAAIIAIWDRGFPMSEAIALRATLAQRLEELRRRLATYHSFDDAGAGEAADRIAAVALAIEEIDALAREEASA